MMSKPFLVGLGILLLAATAVPVSPQQGAAVSKPAVASDVARIAGATAEILNEVSELRGLEVKSPVKSRLKSREEISRMVLEDLEQENTPEEIRANELLMRRLGLIPGDFDLKSYLVKLYTEQIAGFYEPRTKEFYVADWIPLDEQRPVMAHELTHALQDQHFSLRRFQRLAKGQSDAELAIHAMIEGEATDIMLNWAYRGEKLDITRFPPLREALQSMSNGKDKNYPLLDHAPEVIKQNLLFPYFYGAEFVQSVVKSSSWKRMTEAYARPPLSTEQVMHPEKFLADERPILIELPDLAPLLGRGWKRIDSDVLGEFNLYVALKEFIAPATAARAAQGWAGDRYGFYEIASTHRQVLVEYSSWDTPLDAREYFEAETARLKGRYSSSKVLSSSDRLERLQTGEVIVSLELRGSDVLEVDGASEPLVHTLVDRTWQAKKSVMEARLHSREE